MDNDVNGQTETDADGLSFDIPDDAVERAAGTVDGRAITWGFCTREWIYCGWPV